MSKIYRLVSIIKLDEQLQCQILKIRNEENVRKWMLNDNLINITDHLKWIENLRTDKSQLNFVIIDEDYFPIGSVNLKKINNLNKNSELGFYKTQNYTEKGIMTKCIYCLLNYSFSILKLNKIYSEVLEGNIKSINIHKKLSFNNEGFLRSQIFRDNKYIGLHLFGLLKNEWQLNQNNQNIRNDIQIEIMDV